MNIISLVKRQIAKGKQPPEPHTCPYCGAPLTRLHILRGGILRTFSDSHVKAAVGCRDCKRMHTVKGRGLQAHMLVMQLMAQPRGSVRMAVQWQGNGEDFLWTKTESMFLRDF